MRRSCLPLAALLLAACAAAPPAPTPAPAPPSPVAAAPAAAAQPGPTIAPSPTAPPSPTAAPSSTPAPRYDLVLSGATLIDATGAPPLPGAEVAVLGGRIVAVGPAGSIAYSPDTPVRELAGATILPGFINAHAHTADLSDEQLRGWTRAGVTTVRDLSGPLALVARRDALAAAGDPSLPRLLVSGPTVTVAGGHPIPVYGLSERVRAVSGPDDARAQISALADAGVNQIKIAVSGRTDVSWPELSDAEIAAITETARARGIVVSAHVDRAGGLRRAVLNGIGDAAHSPRDRVPDDLIALMVQRGVGLIPTIDVYEALAEGRGAAAEWRRVTLPVMYDNLGRFAAAGGTLALGDDFGGAPGSSIGMPMDEIGHWLAAGLSPQQVIEAATRGSATVAGLSAELGTVEAGKIADLLVVQGDPLSDIGALARPVLVLRGGLEVAP